MEPLAGGKEEVGKPPRKEDAGTDPGAPAFPAKERGLRQRKEAEESGVDRQPLQDKMPGDKKLDQHGIEHTVGQNRGCRRSPLVPLQQRQDEEKAADGQQEVEEAVSLPVPLGQVVLVFGHQPHRHLDQRIQQQIGRAGGQSGQAVMEPGDPQAEQQTEGYHNQGGPVEAGRQEDDAQTGEKAAALQEGIDPQKDGRGHRLPQKVHAQREILEGQEEVDAQPWGGGVTPHPHKNQQGKQQVEDKEKGPVIAPHRGDSQVEQQVAGFDLAQESQSGQSGAGGILKNGFVKPVVKAGDIPQRGQQPAEQAHGQQVGSAGVRFGGKQRPAGKTAGD